MNIKCIGHKKHWACIEDYPDHMVPASNFNKNQFKCRACEKWTKKEEGVNKKLNPKNNIISRIAYDYGGGTIKDFYNLPKEERLHMRAIATEKYDQRNMTINSFPFRTHRKLPKVRRPKGKRVTVFKPNDPRGFVYIFKDHMKSVNGWLYYYKVGASHDPQERLNQANTWGDFESVWESDMVDDCASLEKEVHQALSKYRVKGEWFQCDKTFIINKILELIDAREEQAMAEQKVS